MGEIEKSNRRKVRRGEIQKIVLQSIKLAGLLSVALVAPNVISTMKKLGLLSNKRQSEIVSSSVGRLVKKGLLKFNGRYYELTIEGERKLRQFELVDYKLSPPKKWDKKWRVVIFDIPEKKKRIREQIRNMFITIGFQRLQDSVWVYPYDCEDVVGLLKADFGVGGDILYMIVDEIEGDVRLLQKFNLKK